MAIQQLDGGGTMGDVSYRTFHSKFDVTGLTFLVKSTLLGAKGIATRSDRTLFGFKDGRSRWGRSMAMAIGHCQQVAGLTSQV